MKKRITAFLIILGGSWLIAGIAARRSMFSILGNVDLESADITINCDDYVFGIKFNEGVKGASCRVVWLNEAENIEMGRLLKNAKIGACMSSDEYFMDNGSMDGCLYIVPHWVHVLGLKSILFPLMDSVAMFYWPSKKLLYLSEDVEELGYDYSRGLNIINVQPSILHIEDIDQMHKIR